MCGLVINTETAINQPDENQQDTYRHLAPKKINKILRETSTENALHKKQKHFLR
jgi:hypothetical protein